MINIVKQNGTPVYGVINLVADTPTDLANLPTDIEMGSTCFVISTSDNYMLNSSKQWIRVLLPDDGADEVIYNGGYDG